MCSLRFISSYGLQQHTYLLSDWNIIIMKDILSWICTRIIFEKHSSPGAKANMFLKQCVFEYEAKMSQKNTGWCFSDHWFTYTCLWSIYYIWLASRALEQQYLPWLRLYTYTCFTHSFYCFSASKLIPALLTASIVFISQLLAPQQMSKLMQPHLPVSGYPGNLHWLLMAYWRTTFCTRSIESLGMR